MRRALTEVVLFLAMLLTAIPFAIAALTLPKE